MAFPAGPYTDGQVVTDNGVTYVYNLARGAFSIKRNDVTVAPNLFATGTLSARPVAAIDGFVYYVTGDSVSANNNIFWGYDTDTKHWYSWRGA